MSNIDNESISKYERTSPYNSIQKASWGDNEAAISTRIMSQLVFMSDQMTELEVLVRSLADKLDPILVPDQNDLARVVDTPPDRTSVVSMILDEKNSQLSAMQRQIIQIKERVQL